MSTTLTPYNARTALLLGEKALSFLSSVHVVVAGTGGVGAYAVEMLARSGVGHITIIDGDNVSESNVNRQLPALISTVGKSKVEVMKHRILDINPSCTVDALNLFLNPDNIAECIPDSTAWVVDAIDSISPKVALIEYCHRHKIKIISSMGAGGRIDPTKVQYADISETFHDGLAREVRHRLRRRGISKGIKVVFSTEQPRKNSIILTDEIAFKASSFGTVAWIPAQFGLMLGAYVINNLTHRFL